MHRGYIKAWRKILTSSMYKSLTASQRDVLWACLLSANHNESEWEWQGNMFRCKPGQFITSLDSMKGLCARDTSIRNIRTALVKLEKYDFLANKSTKTGRLISITNWDSYQQDTKQTDKQTDKGVTKDRQSTDKALTPNKNDKNYKNGKNKEIKTRFLDHVDLKDKEFETLKKKYGETRANRMIEVLNNYFMANTKRLKKYTSHYGAINSWVVGDVLEKMPMEGSGNESIYDRLIRENEEADALVRQKGSNP